MPQTPRRNIRDAAANHKSSVSKLEYNRKRYWEKREQLLAQNREYYRKNRDKLLQKSKEYIEKYPAETKAYKQKWHRENKDKVIAKAVKWNKENRERRLAIQAKYRKDKNAYIKAKNKEYRVQYRELAISYYSNNKNKCACCGESTYQFLTIDHINGDGAKHRKEIGVRGGHHFYYWLKRNNFPDGFQVLCANCNVAKGVNSVCPHQTPQSTVSTL